MFCLIKEGTYAFLQQFRYLQSELTASVTGRFGKYLNSVLQQNTGAKCPEESTPNLKLRAQSASGKNPSVSAKKQRKSDDTACFIPARL